MLRSDDSRVTPRQDRPQDVVGSNGSSGARTPPLADAPESRRGRRSHRGAMPPHCCGSGALAMIMHFRNLASAPGDNEVLKDAKSVHVGIQFHHERQSVTGPPRPNHSKRRTHLAIPRNTARQRSTSTIASALIRPKAGPTLSRFTVMALSAITCDGFCKTVRGAWLNGDAQ